MVNSVAQHFDKGEVIFSEGQKGNTFYIIKSGRVEITLEQNGRKVTLGTLGPGSCFGEMAALTGERRAASATALSSTLAVEIDTEYVTKWTEVQDPLLRTVLKSLSERVRHLNEEKRDSSKDDNLIISVATMLNTLGKSQVTAESQEVSVSLYEAVSRVSRVTGRSRPLIDEVVNSMTDLGLLRTSGDGFDRQLVFSPDNLEKHTKGLTKILGKTLDPRDLNTLDLVTLDMLAFHLQADPDEVYDILSQAENFSDLICYKLTDAITAFTELTEEPE
jgi:CRP/FNR family transcriptional regulator, cyclic AMP receptor protein